MTFIAVSIFIDHPADIDRALHRARLAADAGAQLVEWRLDHLADDPDAFPAVVRLLGNSLLPCILTVRSVDQGGLYDGTQAARIAFLERIAAAALPPAAAPRYIDFELPAWQSSANVRQKVLLAVQHDHQPRDLTTSLILSAHHLAGRPPNLLQQYQAMADEPACRVIKLAWFARSLRDNLQAFELLRIRAKPSIILCIGPFGLLSRVLAPKFGALLSFAADGDDTLTAPGQPTLQDLTKLYRFNAINQHTRVYGVIGWPLGHSRSPAFHNAAFARANANAVYLPLPIPPEYEHFKATLSEFLAFTPLHFRGASVTSPHKEHLVRFVCERNDPRDEIEPFALAIAAANTLTVRDDGSLLAANTDGPAAVQCICEAMNRSPADLAGLNMLILGAGGVARAIAGSLARHGARCTIFNRSVDRARTLISTLNASLTKLNPAFYPLQLGDPINPPPSADLIVNCTSIGMTGGPAPDANPLRIIFNDRASHLLHPHALVFDTVYASTPTPFQQGACSHGATLIHGEELFIRQAALQSSLFTGCDLSPNLARLLFHATS